MLINIYFIIVVVVMLYGFDPAIALFIRQLNERIYDFSKPPLTLNELVSEIIKYQYSIMRDSDIKEHAAILERRLGVELISSVLKSSQWKCPMYNGDTSIRALANAYIKIEAYFYEVLKEESLVSDAVLTSLPFQVYQSEREAYRNAIKSSMPLVDGGLKLRLPSSFMASAAPAAADAVDDIALATSAAADAVDDIASATPAAADAVDDIASATPVAADAVDDAIKSSMPLVDGGLKLRLPSPFMASATPVAAVAVAQVVAAPAKPTGLKGTAYQFATTFAGAVQSFMKPPARHPGV